jgi:hypothetical protein
MDLFIQKRLTKIINQVDVYNQHAQRKLSQSFKNKYDPKLFIIFLYYSQIDFFKNIQTLLQSKNPISIPILVRSAIDLVSLMKIANKDINKIFAHYKHQLNVDIKNILTDFTAKEMEKLSKNELIEITYLLHVNSAKQTELKNISKKKMYEIKKRKLADISNELNQLYLMLSDHVHHGYDTLVQRYGIIKENSYKSSKSKKIPKCILYMCLHALLLCLILSIVELFKCTGLPGNHNLKSLYAEIHHLDRLIKKRIDRVLITD